MNRYSNESSYNEYSQHDCQCPYRNTCGRYGYRNNNDDYYDNDNDYHSNRSGCSRNRNNGCSICNLFRRCGN